MSVNAVSTTPRGPNIFGDAIYPGASQSKNYSNTSVQADTAMGATTGVVQVVCTTVAFVAIGANPTAVVGTGGAYIPANTPVKFACNPGDKVAVIRSAADGVMYLCEGA